MSPNYQSVQKQRLSFPYNYFAVKRLLRDFHSHSNLFCIRILTSLDFVSTFDSSIKADRIKASDTYKRIYNAGEPRKISEKKSNQIKAEKSNQSPVNGSDDH